MYTYVYLSIQRTLTTTKQGASVLSIKACLLKSENLLLNNLGEVNQ